MLTDGLPLRALLLTANGWAGREQQRTIEYLIKENRVLKEQLGGRRLRLTNDQRRPPWPCLYPLLDATAPAIFLCATWLRLDEGTVRGSDHTAL